MIIYFRIHARHRSQSISLLKRSECPGLLEAESVMKRICHLLTANGQKYDIFAQNSTLSNVPLDQKLQIIIMAVIDLIKIGCFRNFWGSNYSIGAFFNPKNPSL
mgnify:CR=1 FL=1